MKGVIKTEQLGTNKFLVFTSGDDLRPALFKHAVKNNLTLLTLHEQESSMEHSFLNSLNKRDNYYDMKYTILLSLLILSASVSLNAQQAKKPKVKTNT